MTAKRRLGLVVELMASVLVFFFQAEDGIRDYKVTGVQTCAFFFSSRRRFTRLQGDWSSDVCSSELRQSRQRRNQILYALAGLMLPLTGLAQWFDPVARQRLGIGPLGSELLIVLVTWLIAVTVIEIGRASCRERV